MLEKSCPPRHVHVQYFDQAPIYTLLSANFQILLTSPLLF